MTSRAQSEFTAPDNDATGNVLHHERLWPSPGIWSVAAWFGVMMFLAFLAVDFWWGLISFAVGTAGAAAAMVLGTPTIRVTAGGITCGRASLEMEFVGEVKALDAADVKALRGVDYNDSAFMCQRAWLKSGVRFDVQDPRDPTPYWFISSRKPKALAAAIVRARAK